MPLRTGGAAARGRNHIPRKASWRGEIARWTGPPAGSAGRPGSPAGDGQGALARAPATVDDQPPLRALAAGHVVDGDLGGELAGHLQEGAADLAVGRGLDHGRAGVTPLPDG